MRVRRICFPSGGSAAIAHLLSRAPRSGDVSLVLNPLLYLTCLALSIYLESVSQPSCLTVSFTSCTYKSKYVLNISVKLLCVDSIHSRTELGTRGQG